MAKKDKRPAPGRSIPSSLEKAVAILRRYGDTRRLPENECGKMSHYAILHAQEKRISAEDAWSEVSREFQNGTLSEAALVAVEGDPETISQVRQLWPERTDIQTHDTEDDPSSDG